VQYPFLSGDSSPRGSGIFGTAGKVGDILWTSWQLEQGSLDFRSSLGGGFCEAPWGGVWEKGPRHLNRLLSTQPSGRSQLLSTFLVLKLNTKEVDWLNTCWSGRRSEKSFKASLNTRWFFLVCAEWIMHLVEQTGDHQDYYCYCFFEEVSLLL